MSTITQERDFILTKITELEQQVATTPFASYSAERLPEVESNLAFVEKSKDRFLALHHDISKRLKVQEKIDSEAEVLNTFLSLCHTIEMTLNEVVFRLREKPTQQTTHSPVDQQMMTFLVKSIMDQQKDVMSELLGTHKSGIEAVANSINTRTSKSNLKLPQIDLPVFTGNISDWQEFHDLFSSTIHTKAELTTSEKFQYLKSSLSGEPARLLKTLKVTDANYNEAWDTLVKRYNKPRNIVFDHIKTFIAQSKKVATNPTELRQAFNTFEQVIKAMDALKTTTRDPWLIHTAMEALDPETKSLWSRTPLANNIPTWSEFMEFLESRCDSWESCYDGKSESKPTKNSSASKVNPAQKFSKPSSSGKSSTQSTPSTLVTTVEEGKKCLICSAEYHHISQCPLFLNSPPKRRIELTKENKLCLNCLRPSHGVRDCRSSWCRKCNLKHNTLLHDAYQSTDKSHPNSQEVPASKAGSNTQSQTNALINHVALPIQVNRHTILPSVQVLVTGQDGLKHRCRALLDSCSQTNSVSRNFANKLALPLKDSHVGAIKGIGSICTNTPQSITAEIEDTNNIVSMVLDFLVLEHITDDQPAVEVKIPYQIPSHVTLADPDFGKPGPIDMLLGADVFMSVLRSRKVAGSPTLQETTFGYIVAGCFESHSDSTSSVYHLITCLCSTEDASLNTQMEKFWTLEEVKAQKPLSVEEQKCEAHFALYTSRNSDGRYVVRLPTREDLQSLGDSRYLAEKRFRCIERRLQRDENLYTQYRDFMRQYESLGHMRKLPEGYTSPKPAVYLCHHPVIKESTSTPVRVVFDASAKTTSGKSLNSVLLVGAKTQDDLFEILLRFRQHNVILKADIQKMYRQIIIHEEDQNMQRILWRENPQQPLQTYLLSTVTYGTASAPFLATRCLQQLVTDEGQHFPCAAPVVERDFYVDDLLTGTSDVESAQLLRQELISMLQRGGFSLKKWSSNSSEIMSRIPQEDHEKSSSLSMGEESVKTLGLHWTPNSDCFRFTTTDFHSSITKRTILSDMAKMFDPLGLLAPVTISAKILMQSLWKIQTDWDSTLDAEVCEKWLDYQNSVINSVNNIKVPRKFTSFEDPKSVQLFAFSDASERAYAACVYIRSIDTENNVSSRLLCAKTKVAPLKQISLPRLELCGAVLLKRLVEKVISALSTPISEIHAFTDSMIVLCWINAESRRWQTFVANRVSEIQNTIPATNWHHVTSKENPADLASRGVSAADLSHDSLWWNGPSWITSSELNFEATEIELPDDAHLEMRHNVSLVTTQNDFSELIGRVSSLPKLVRIVAYCRRFILNTYRTYKKQETMSGCLSPGELSQARVTIVRLVQKESFPGDYQNLSKNNVVSRQSKLRNLNPFLDETGLIRVGGRIRHADVRYDYKHPAILPPHHHITRLLALESHHSTLHGGAQMTLSHMRQNFWPLRGIDVTKRTVRECVPCFRVKPRTAEQLMSDCHISRVSGVHPFHRTGVDFCGPFHIKPPVRSKTRLKMYVALFICLATRAIHIELVADLTTSAFLASLRRFIARRGKPFEILCDNATNFVGASRELAELQQMFESSYNQSQIIEASAEQGINFKFIPPRSPHFGGSWESSIKRLKHHLYRTIGLSHLTEQEMLTILVQIEGCLNSRPIMPMSTDPSDLEALTPGHFLIGRPLNAIPEEQLTEIPENRLKTWKLVQQRLQFFWKRWATEYLHTLQQRKKWTTPFPSLQPGALVIIKEDHLPPMKWSLGRIIKCYSGADGNVRVVSVKTSSGEYTRAIVKLCPLPIPESS
ncbi:uncharacterized protein LOC129801041 [Phlebotomus papatasi]|uniref:uncharacterized protein LOC129801041 n=1 Tax=Phlebotomus papatasi TaxID=29031 RepID=UPI002483E9B1|nr:uncharacterized protein LOC129801041 [Phlebotomus papatasi]